MISSNGRKPQILIVEYLSNHYSDLLQILNLSLGDHTKTKILKMKLTLNERQPQNSLSWISQQPLIGSSWNLKLELRGTYQNLKWRRPPMEDDFTICDLWVRRKKFWEYSEENSSVALLSPACYILYPDMVRIYPPAHDLRSVFRGRIIILDLCNHTFHNSEKGYFP